MNTKIFSLLGILAIISLVPLVDAQISIDEKANQKSVEITIDSDGEVHVSHVIRASNLPQDLELVSGTVSNISVTNEQGDEEFFSTIDEDTVLLQPSDKELIVEYDLEDVLINIDNTWTWNFRYLETTTFLIPKEVDLFFVNERPVYLDNKKGFACHGCQMILEYTINESRKIEQVNWGNEKFAVGMITFAEIENFEFNQQNKKISFKINDENLYLTTMIPLELLSGTYEVMLNDEKISFHKYNNGTHDWISIKPDTTGEISIIDTTVKFEPDNIIEVIECGWWEKFLAFFGIGKC